MKRLDRKAPNDAPPSMQEPYLVRTSAAERRHIYARLSAWSGGEKGGGETGEKYKRPLQSLLSLIYNLFKTEENYIQNGKVHGSHTDSQRWSD